MSSSHIATHRLAVIPGDGIGPEVTAEALKVLEAVAPAAVKFESTRYDLGAERYLATGEVLPDTVLVGDPRARRDPARRGGRKPGDPSLPPGILERGLLLRLRFELDHYVNLRPSRIYPGVTTPLADPGEVDFVVVREGTEGPYVGNGGALRVGTPARDRHRGQRQHGVRRGARRPRRVRPGAEAAAQEADPGAQDQRARPRRRGLVADRRTRSRRSSPRSSVDYLHVDAATIFLATDPARFDVIVTDNLFGDIITDLAAAVTGGIGLAASGNINPDRTTPSMFEPVHGSAPDIAGQQKADPTAAILSAALLLEHLGLDDAARSGRGRRRGRARRADPGTAPASHLRGRRRGRRTSSRLSAVSSPLDRSFAPPERQVPCTTWRALCTSRSRRRPRRSTDRLAEILAEPRLRRCTSPTTCSWPSGRPTQGWHDARVTPYAPLSLDPATAVLHYAQEIFEGMKAYRHEDGSVWTFRPEENAARMVRSSQPARAAGAAGRGLHRAVDALVQADERWVPEPAGEKSLYLRPFMFASEVFLGVRPSQHVTFMVIASPAGAYFAKGVKPGLDLALRGLHPRRARRHGRGQDRRQLRQLAGRRSRRPSPRAATRWSSSTPPRAGTSRSSAA